MSVQTPQSARTPSGYDTYADEYRDQGWLVFAGTLLLILGTMNCIEGIAAIGKAHFFIANQNYVIGDLRTWGWVTLAIGALQLAVGFGVFVKNQLARWAGLVVLSLNAIAQLMIMPAYPFWSLSLFAVDILAISALIAHGKRREGEI